MTHHTKTSVDSVKNIPSNYSRLIARELGLTARQLPELLQGTGLRAAQLLSDNGLITSAQQIQILRNALALSGRPGFGLRLGRRLTPATHGTMGFAASSSPNLLSAFQAIHTFLPTRVGVIELRLYETEDNLECRVTFKIQLDNDLLRCVAELIVTVLLNFGEFILGRALEEAEIGFTHVAPEYQAIYAEYLSGRIDFCREQLTLRLPMALCLEPNASANHESYQLALQHCEVLLEQLQAQTSSYQNRLKKMMLSRPPGTLSEEEAAATLLMSKRTLARKLKKEQSSFRKIREEILSNQAASYLGETTLSMEEIAVLLNYHDSANFRRAFKRWFGQPPNDYRRIAYSL